MSVPQTNSALAASGAWNSGIGMPSWRKNETRSGRWCSFPQPVFMKSQPTQMRARVGGSQASFAATVKMTRRSAAIHPMSPLIGSPS